MALIVEDGTGKSNSESLCSVAFADQYHSDRANAAWALLSTANKEAALRKSTDYIGQTYRDAWKGYRRYSIQALDWPRVGVMIDKFVYIYDYQIPTDVQKACAEYALKASSAELNPDKGKNVIRQKVDAIEVEYDKSSPQNKRYSAIESLLAPYLTGGGSSARLVRT